MQTREIPREEWRSFFEAFSRTHEGWRVTVEALGDDIGDQVEAAGIPLGEITAEDEPDGRCVINLILGGGERPSPVTHIIDDARRVFVEETEDGVDVSVEIEEADSAKLLVRLEQAAATRQLEEPARR
jgi:hypothetical protein